MTKLPLVALLTTLTSTTGQAEQFYSPDDFQTASVRLLDDAKNGCWTNIGETKTYAEDQLRLRGLDVVQRDSYEFETDPFWEDGHIAFLLRVEAQRIGNGLCAGHVIVMMAKSWDWDDRSFVAGTLGYPASWSIWDDNNLNTLVLDFTKGFISNWASASD